MIKKILFILFIPVLAWGNTIEQPPVDGNLSVQTSQYLQTLYNNLNKVNITTTDPNGNIRGDLGELRIYNNTGNLTMKVCTSSPTGTTWDNVTYITPTADEFQAGMIMLWSGLIANIPTGWHLCDGTEGTPDLRGRFVMAADSDSGGTYDVNDTGDGSIPQHNHAIGNENAHTHTVVGKGGDAGIS